MPDTIDFAAELNPQQLAAATFGDGPLLVVAGAGTGKTRTLVYRVAHLIDRGVRPHRILLLTFTRRAAQEMLGRVADGSWAAPARVCTVERSTRRRIDCYARTARPPVWQRTSRSGSGRRRGSDADVACCARIRAAQVALSEERDAALRLLPAHEHGNSRRRHPSRRVLPQFVELAADYHAHLRGLHHAEGASATSSTTTISCSSGRRCSRHRRRSPIASHRSTITCSWMSIRTRTSLQARILRAMCRRRTATSPWSATTRRASTPSAARASATSSTSRSQFAGTTIVALEQNYRSTQPILDVTQHADLARAERYTKNRCGRSASAARRPWLVTTQDEQQQTTLRRRSHPRAARARHAACARWRCCFAPATCRRTSRSSSRIGRSRSRSGADSSSSRRRT